MKLKKIILFVTLFLLFFLFLIYKGYIWPNQLFAKNYLIHGIDISHHQNEINWGNIADDSKIKFAFIKATEGEDFIDPLFETNWSNSKNAGLIRGAYHFYSFSSSGKAQAENFISNVPVEENTLPPVIDIEFSGNSKNVPSREELTKELNIFISIIENTYKQKPILYLTYDSYNDFIKGDYEEYDIWIRDIVKPPNLENQDWLFWQYSNRGRIEGINTYVDQNVFYGDMEEFEKLLTK